MVNAFWECAWSEGMLVGKAYFLLGKAYIPYILGKAADDSFSFVKSYYYLWYRARWQVTYGVSLTGVPIPKDIP